MFVRFASPCWWQIKLEALGKTANEAVLSDPKDTFHENEDETASDDETDTDESDDDDEHHEEQIHTDGRDNESTIDTLLQRICQWRQALIPR